jgi:arginase
MTRPITFIGSACGWGAQIRSTEKGPLALKNLLEKLSFPDLWQAIVYPEFQSPRHPLPLGPEVLPVLIPHLEKLAQEVEKSFQGGSFPVIIGGDHSMAIGSISGAVHALGPQKRFGLIWMDAHMDAHTPQTTPSKAYHGMPLAALLGYGDPTLTSLVYPGPKLQPQDLVLLGPRDYESEEAQFLKDQGVHIIFHQTIQERGFLPCLQQALERVTRHTQAFGLSLDLDMFDPTIAPGVGSRSPHGLFPQEVLPSLHLITDHPLCRLVEITEFNPSRDKNQQTGLLIIDILKKLFPPLKDLS